MPHAHRTAVTRLSVSAEARAALEATLDAYRRGCAIAVDSAFGRATSDTAVQSMAYDRIRAETELHSQHAILACRQTASALRSYEELADAGREPSKPTFSAPTMTFDRRTMTLFDDGAVSLATLGRRVRVDLALPDDADNEGYQQQFLDSDSWSVTESTLTITDGEFHLHLGFRRETEEPTPAENGTVLGVDLGVSNLAVTSTATFFSGDELRHRRDEFARCRSQLQQCGTRSAHRTLHSVGGREYRYVRDVLHRVSNGIVAEADDHDCDLIAFEELDGIRERLPDAGWFHVWAFGRLVEFVRYKARDADIAVETVDPRNTSRRCADCGHVADANRPTRDRFRCGACGNEANADYNAAKNVGLRYVRRGPQSSRGTGTRRCALKSGTVGESGFRPASVERFTDKPA